MADVSSAYYTRENILHLDGTKVFRNAETMAGEREVAARIEEVWQCKLHEFGALCPIDWFAVRHDRLVGLIELKSRSHVSGEYPTVFLSVRKWLALSLGSVGMGVPSIFIVRFVDRISWAPLAAIDGSYPVMRGGTRRAQSKNDFEPMIEVPVGQMKILCELAQ